MKSKAIFTMVAMAAMSLTAFAADGGEIYKAKCASCHGADGAGAMAKKMGSRDLNSAEFQSSSDADINAVIAKGKGKMPGYEGKLSADDITAVTKYIRTLKK
jgi:mono/diheme cytochrome c family protein